MNVLINSFNGKSNQKSENAHTYSGIPAPL